MFSQQFNENIRYVSPIAIVLLACITTWAADRTTFFLPLASDATTQTIPGTPQFPDAAMGPAASDGWRAYIRLWRAHHADPADKSIRKYLGSVSYTHLTLPTIYSV